METKAAPRLHSLDVFRGLVILAMLFVNDIAGVKGLPTWMGHMPTHTDAMTFVDLVFPSFLFMVGMALPFALGRKLDQGAKAGQVWRHVLQRSASLLVMGVFMVNADGFEGGHLGSEAWQLLLYCGVFLVWCGYGSWAQAHPTRVRFLRILGVLMMAAAVLCFHSSLGNGLAAFRPQWWGILGLIGWAYLLGCLCYIPLRRHPEALLGCLVLCLLIQLAAPFGLGDQLRFPGGSHPLLAAAPHAALVLAGALLGSILRPESPLSTPLQRVRWALGFALGLYAASVLLHQLAGLHEVFIVSKNLATPTWCLRSAAYATLLWTAIYLLVDVAGLRWGVDFLAQAGQNALFAYILAPLVLSLVGLGTGLLHLPGWWALGSSLALGLARGAISAFAFVALAGTLSRKELQLKL